MACDRYRTSDRAEAAVASAVLQDTRCNNISGLIQCIDKTKSDENESESGSSCKQAKNNELSWGFSLTGVKTKLKSLEKRESIFFDDVSQRNIYQQSANKAWGTFGHVTPKGCSAECLKSSIFEYLSENHISAEKLLSVGCNGTNINTGRAGGVITLLEQELRNHYSSLSACFMVMNSLSDTYCRVLMEQQPVRVHFAALLGKRLSTCEQLPVTYFVRT